MLRPLTTIALLLTVMIAALQFSGVANASEKMDLDTHSLVVDKLRSVLKNDIKDVARAPIQLRLADVLAERARIKVNLEVEANCQNCKQAKEDRKEALSLYESAFENKNVGAAVDKGAVLIQMAHLNELLLENEKAARIYEQAISSPKGKYSQKTIATSYSSLGDYHFRKGEFSKSKSFYEKALKISSEGMKGSITYRIAWCKLNLGDTAQATAMIRKILNTPELMTRETSQGPTFDASFQVDVSRDFATFLARGQVSQKSIEELKAVSPEKVQKSNVEYLATEADRLGDRKGSLLAWSAYLELEPNKEERLVAYARISRLHVENGNRDQAVQSLNGLAQEFSAAKCNSESCQKVIENTRKLIGDWAKVEKKNPSSQLLQGYLAYLKMKSDDLDMIFWAANLAAKLKQNQQAISLFRNASDLAHSKLGKGKTEKERTATQSVFEASLLSEIEIAETTKNIEARISAYNHYLNLNPAGSKAWEVKYQLAYIDYEAGKVASAVTAFHNLALVKPCRNELCTKAADLSIDGLVTIKDEPRIETYAVEYAKAFPSQSASYLKIARTSVTNQVIRLSQKSDISQSEAAKGLIRLQAVPLSGASESEVVANLKLQISLAEKANDLGQVIAASNKLAGIKGVSAADKSFAVGKLAWAFEMSFNFEKAYQVVSRIDAPKNQQAQHSLRLAVLADLGGMNPARDEDRYLKLKPHGSDATLLRTKKIRRASNSRAEFQKHSKFLPSELAGQLALEVFAKTDDSKFANKILLQSKLRNTQAARTYAGLQLVQEIAQAKKELSRHALRASSDAVLASSLQTRMKLVSRLDKLAIEATQLRDWSAETLAITGLAQENQRLYSEIMNLPVPRKLKAQHRAQYQAAVASKAAPFARNAQILNERAEQLWNQTASLDVITDGFKETPAQYRSPLALRIKALQAQAPSSAKSELSSALSSKSNQVSTRDLVAARKDAQRQPFNVSAVSRLKELESKAGRDSMVAYLDGRLTMLKASGRM